MRATCSRILVRLRLSPIGGMVCDFPHHWRTMPVLFDPVRPRPIVARVFGIPLLLLSPTEYAWLPSAPSYPVASPLRKLARLYVKVLRRLGVVRQPIGLTVKARRSDSAGE